MTPADYETMRPVFSDPEHGLCLNPVLACCLGSKCVGTWWELLFICLLHFGHATRYLGTSIPLMCITLLQHRTVAVAGHQWASSTGLDYERSKVFESTNDGTRPTTAGSHPWRSRDEEESALIVVPKVKQMKPAEVRRIMLKMTRFIGKKSTKKGVGGKGRAAHSRGKNLLTHNKQQNQVDDRRSRRWKSHGLSLLLRIRPHDVVEDVSFLGLLGSPFCLSSFLIAEGAANMPVEIDVVLVASYNHAMLQRPLSTVLGRVKHYTGDYSTERIKCNIVYEIGDSDARKRQKPGRPVRASIPEQSASEVLLQEIIASGQTDGQGEGQTNKRLEQIAERKIRELIEGEK